MLKYATGTTMLKSEVNIETVDIVESNEFPSVDAQPSELTMSMTAQTSSADVLNDSRVAAEELIQSVNEQGQLTEEQFHELKLKAQDIYKHSLECDVNSPEIEEFIRKIQDLKYTADATQIARSMSETVVKFHAEMSNIAAQRAEEDRERISKMIDIISAEDNGGHAPPGSPIEPVEELVEKFEHQVEEEKKEAEACEVCQHDHSNIQHVKDPEENEELLEVKTAEPASETSDVRTAELQLLNKDNDLPIIPLSSPIYKSTIESKSLCHDSSKSMTLDSTANTEKKKKKSGLRRAIAVVRRGSQRLKDRILGHHHKEKAEVSTTETQTAVLNDDSQTNIPTSPVASSSAIRPKSVPPRPPLPTESQA
ncbi:hypothetical protein M3Y98_00997500 [Aphelenchoides besseyi]|nr:hypothetical protein M3Y98_00997500 [Aphelenchoides besseyi]KAI6195122.1 hypothetical protein M3Y96_01197300 [Aphelenchoides besseyi]